MQRRATIWKTKCCGSPLTSKYNIGIVFLLCCFSDYSRTLKMRAARAARLFVQLSPVFFCILEFLKPLT